LHGASPPIGPSRFIDTIIDEMSSAPLSRQEAKLVTRQRLLDAAHELLVEEGHAGVVAARVSKRAGIAQSSFYAHFRDKDDLLRTLARETTDRLRRALRDARAFAAEEMTPDRVRDVFRISIDAMKAQPELFRLFARERQQGTPFGEYCRALYDEMRRDLAEDLMRIGSAPDTPDTRRKAEMVADGLIAFAESLGTGHIEGRYPDVEEVLDVLVALTPRFAE
jgi:AcrR family transcriptional regulator